MMNRFLSAGVFWFVSVVLYAVTKNLSLFW